MKYFGSSTNEVAELTRSVNQIKYIARIFLNTRRKKIKFLQKPSTRHFSLYSTDIHCITA